MEQPGGQTDLNIDQQLDYLFEGTYFADEGGLADSAEAGETSLRSQMRAELKKKLEKSAETGMPLRVYIGVDPTRESLHIGHMVSAVNLRRFQNLGHTLIFLIGDYTATIGDPSGQSTERETLTHARVLELSEFYQDQAFRLLERDKTEVRYNSEWLADLRFAELAELAAQFPLNQILARQDFRDRLQSGAGVRMHEAFYALMQGYDAYALNCDVQVGGYDQHFNLLAGRVLQKYFKHKLAGADHPQYAAHPATGKYVKGPHVMLTYPLLMGTDGRKMSKSWGNTIDVLDAPADMYGKVMRISDEMIAHYIDIAVEAPPEEKSRRKEQAKTEPMDVKKWIARSLTALYHDDQAADEAAAYFQRTVQEKSFSETDIEELQLPAEFSAGPHKLADLLLALQLAPSRKEAQRLIDGGAVRLDGVTVEDRLAEYTHKSGTILQVGKRKVVLLI